MKLRFREFNLVGGDGGLHRTTINLMQIVNIVPLSDGVGTVLYMAGRPAGRDWVQIQEPYETVRDWLMERPA